MGSTPVSIELGGRTLRLSNLDKPLYPSGFTKADVIDYYRRIAPAILPHLKGRPLTLKRYPGGSTGESFYEKQCPAHRPPWLRTIPVWNNRRSANMDYCVIDGEAALVWVANLASIELHTPLARARRLDRPDMLAFDLDPGAPADILDCARVALRLREVLAGWSLRSYVKTSGRKGLQIYVPLHPPSDYEETKPFANAVARLLAEEQPERITWLMAKDLRGGKVFIDWSQNDEHKTTVCAYSLRAAERPMVSTPLEWAEVERAVATGRRDLLVFEARDVLRRFERRGDLFSEVLDWKQRLPAIARRKPEKRAVTPRPLKEYAAKRHFDVTPEPAPRRTARGARRPLRFMIHKHHARRLHYDLRLEIAGVLASWAVPRGPSYDPTNKRLAIQTEDHPLEYGDFEGRIPDGEYGAGDSLVWDRGWWDTVPPGKAEEQRERGRMRIELHGEKLRGRWHLVRTGGRSAGLSATKTAWLLFKASDETAHADGDIVLERPESVLSGRVETIGPARRT